MRWSLDPRVLQKLNGTGFEFLRLFSKRTCHDTGLLKALIKSYEHDVGCFIFGRGGIKLYFGLKDVYLITGLPIDVKVVSGVDNKTISLIINTWA